VGMVLVHIVQTDGSDISNNSTLVVTTDGPVLHNELCYNIGRLLLAVSTVLFYMRILHMFTNDKYLGPTLLMMNKMMADFKIFLFLFIVVMLGFGVGYIILLSDPVDFIDNPQYSVIIRGLFSTPSSRCLESCLWMTCMTLTLPSYLTQSTTLSLTERYEARLASYL